MVGQHWFNSMSKNYKNLFLPSISKYEALLLRTCNYCGSLLCGAGPALNDGTKSECAERWLQNIQ